MGLNWRLMEDEFLLSHGLAHPANLLSVSPPFIIEINVPAFPSEIDSQSNHLLSSA